MLFAVVLSCASGRVEAETKTGNSYAQHSSIEAEADHSQGFAIRDWRTLLFAAFHKHRLNTHLELRQSSDIFYYWIKHYGQTDGTKQKYKYIRGLNTLRKNIKLSRKLSLSFDIKTWKQSMTRKFCSFLHKWYYLNVNEQSLIF